MKVCEFCSELFDLPYRRKFCSRKCKEKKHNRDNQIKLDTNPKRREILNKRLIKKRLERNIPLDKPIKKISTKGSGYRAKSGYRFIHRKGHPNANAQGSLAEHVYVMSEHIGRPLKKHESVHHRNGIRDDNSIENLEIWTRAQPSGQRLEDKINWAKKFLSEYGFEITQ